MNKFIVTINNRKVRINFTGEVNIILNNKEYNYNISKLNGNTHRFNIGNKTFLISAIKNGNGHYNITLSGRVFETKVLTELQERAANLIEAKTSKHSKTTIKAPMPGMILKIKKAAGDVLKQGDSLLILEAMKMENEIKSPVSGTIKEINIKEGDAVEKGVELLTIE
jgi:biotin carboxyl carrier protein